MTYVITDKCIGCHRCETICPTGAIAQTNHSYQINSELCNHCVGHYAVPQCWAACPTNDGCVSDIVFATRYTIPQAVGDYWETWFSTYNRMLERLKSAKQPDYWQRWFDMYSQTLSNQLQTHAAMGVKA